MANKPPHPSRRRFLQSTATVGGFIADAKARPGSIAFGSVGVGSATHISAEKFRLAAGLETTHVPYRGGAEVSPTFSAAGSISISVRSQPRFP